MATVFETRLIGNVGKDAVLRPLERGVIAINFPVAHNKNWRDKKNGELKTKTTWVNCTIWKREGDNTRILDLLKKGALVELEGTPFAKAYAPEDGEARAELRLNVTKTNILRPARSEDESLIDVNNREDYEDGFETTPDDFTLDEDDF